ncbi:hypothetical protein N8352_02510 [Porticoccaceae bacterium]|nr:hypothetical protein [Porticoccaceae bacterium]
MYILVYNKKCFTPFVKLVCEIIQPKGIVWLESSGPHEIPLNNQIKQVNLNEFKTYFKKTNNTPHKIICFDIYLLPVVSAIRSIKNEYIDTQFVFIQHGGFFDLAGDKRKKISLNWICRSIKTIFQLLNTINIRYWPKLFFIFIKSFFRGSFVVREEICKLTPQFELGIFWNEADIKLLGNDIKKCFQEIYITRSPDLSKVLFVKCTEEKIVYIDQPLLENKIINREKMHELLNILEAANCKTIILHPKSDINKFGGTNYNFIELNDKLIEINCSSVMGHFSSLLLSVPRDINIKTIDLNVTELIDANSRFLNATKTDIDSYKPSFSTIMEKIR